ncbi:MAG: lipocalin family protein [Fidelibacterota bacterium]
MGKVNLILLMVIFLTTACKNEEADMDTVKQVDINKFMGDWYVQGIIPNFIEKGAANGVESYQLKKDNVVQIQYTFQKNGKTKTMDAKAFIQDDTNAFWKVQFIWPLKLPYLVIDLAEDYSYTVIGIPNKKYVWIMSRQPNMPDSTYTTILDRLDKIGYDTAQINRMEQNW